MYVPLKRKMARVPGVKSPARTWIVSPTLTLLGATIFEMLEREAGARAAVGLATGRLDRGARSLLVEAFGRQLAAVERDWRAELDSLYAAA